jgi:hypothetical protein
MPILNMGSGGIDTSDATADAGKILYPYTAYNDGEKVTGSIPSLAEQTITPGTADQIIASGQYLAGAQTIKGADIAHTAALTSLDLYDDGTYSYLRIPVSGASSIKALGVVIVDATWVEDGATHKCTISVCFVPSTGACYYHRSYEGNLGWSLGTYNPVTFESSYIMVRIGDTDSKISSLSGATVYGAISYV